MKLYALIVAGGAGKRMKSSIPKQFIELNGTPILMRTIEKFYAARSSIDIIVVLPKSFQSVWASLCQRHYFNIPHQVVAGGETRFQSVKKGLHYCKENSIIAVHDGVRPLISPNLILNLYQEAKLKGSTIPVCPILESIRKVEGNQNKSLDRNKFYSVQTPQCFQSKILLKAYEQEEQGFFTDDASVVEALGEKIYLLPGERTNIKITKPIDVQLAEFLLNK